MGDRIRGRAGQALLAQRRADHPTCAACAQLGVVKATAEIDHVVPLAAGGEDVDTNVQGLCHLHHAIKSAAESMSSGGAANHPEWLKPSRARLRMIGGPPCAGKSTAVALAANEGDLVIDLDDIGESLQPGFARRWTPQLLDRAIRTRNALLGSLARMRKADRAFFIVSAPTSGEWAWWQDKLKPEHAARLDPGLDECLKRARLRGPDQVRVVKDWYDRSREPWRADKAKASRQAFGADGYPIE